MLVVFDTNVLVSGLINPHGAPGRVVDLILANIIQTAFDDRAIGEYEEVLTREPFLFQPRRVGAPLDHVRLHGAQVSAPPLRSGVYPDATDLPFPEVALASGALFLVTGNPNHFSFLRDLGVSGLAPQDLLAKF